MTQKHLELTHDLELVHLGSKNASSNVENLRDLLTTVDSCYPGIENWLDKKVLPGLRDDSRRAYLVYHRGKPIASAIAKKGEDAKICNLRISPEFRERGLGDLLFTMLCLSVGDAAKEVHFTIPQSTWEDTSGFFTQFGFSLAGSADRQYRLWDNELLCKADPKDILNAVSRKLPYLISNFAINGASSECSLVISIKPQYAVAILEGRKTIEVRRSFSEKWSGSKALLYSSSPQCEFVGEFQIADVLPRSPSSIWLEFGGQIGCDRETFYAYCGGLPRVFAIKIGAVTPFRSPVSRSKIEGILGSPIRPPQSYLQLGGTSTWAQAASLSQVLQTWP
jgi:predicted transcriptional regulator/ribosomal protein S18 acetylase RimI-like enzyme